MKYWKFLCFISISAFIQLLNSIETKIDFSSGSIEKTSEYTAKKNEIEQMSSAEKEKAFREAESEKTEVIDEYSAEVKTDTVQEVADYLENQIEATPEGSQKEKYQTDYNTLKDAEITLQIKNELIEEGKFIESAEEVAGKTVEESKTPLDQLRSLFDEPVTSENIMKKISDFNQVRQRFAQEGVRLSDLKKELDDIQAQEKKLEALSARRKKLEDILSVVDKEINEVAGRTETTFKTYERMLKQFKDSVQAQREIIDQETLSVTEENIGWFSKMVNTVKNWFDKTFDFHKDAVRNRNVKIETEKLDSIKNDLTNFSKQAAPNSEFKRSVENILNDINDLQTNVIDAAPDEYRSIRERANNLLTVVENALQEIENTQNYLETLNNEVLQEINDSITNKLTLRIYTAEDKNNFPTYFDKLYNIISKEVDKGGYEPNEVYQALFTPEVKKRLNLPEDFDPQTATREQINKAYEQFTQKVSEPLDDPGSAARNAANLLLNPVGRVTYDEFLSEYNWLQKNKIDPEGKKSDIVQNELNNSDLAQLAISDKSVIDAIQEGLLTVNNLRATFIEPLKSNLGKLKTQIQSAKSNLNEIIDTASKEASIDTGL